MERMITSYKLSNLYLKPITGNFDPEHYLSIHKYLFEDIYDFAGDIRNENINKSVMFCSPQFIYVQLDEVLRKAKRLSMNIKNEEELFDFITWLYSELDIIHPFREENGRTEREFIREYVEMINEKIDFGKYHVDYELIENKDEFIKAVIASHTTSSEMLRNFIKKIMVGEQKQK